MSNRCSVREFFVVVAGLISIAAMQVALMQYLGMSTASQEGLVMGQLTLATGIFTYLTYKYCGQPKRVPVRRLGHSGEVRENAVNVTWHANTL